MNRQRRIPVRIKLTLLYCALFDSAALVYILVKALATGENWNGFQPALVGIGIATIVALIAGWVLAGLALRPLRSILTTTRQVSASNLEQRIDLDGPNDEIRELADTIDDLFSRLEHAFTQQQQFVTNAAHELRTPLAIARAAIELGISELAGTKRNLNQLPTYLHQAHTALATTEALLERLLQLARTTHVTTDHAELLDLAEITRAVIDDLRPAAQRADITFDTALSPTPVCGIPGLLDRAIANVLDNAVRYGPTKGVIRVDTAPNLNGEAQIRVVNSGPVFNQETVDSLFAPFNRGPLTRSTNGPTGHGLGLSITTAIVTAHQGTVTARPGVENGLDLAIRLPRSPICRNDKASPTPIATDDDAERLATRSGGRRA
jgi:signal transduction histidine kinase